MSEIQRTVDFAKSDALKQIVYGVVYEPMVKDTDGNFMTSDTIEKMAHDFMAQCRTTAVNKNHTGDLDKGAVVESFVVRKGDHEFPEGAWVVGVHVPDKELWGQIEKGELTGFSIEGMATLVEKGDEGHE